MSGILQKLSPKRQKAILALLSERTIQKAADVTGVGEATLRRWLATEEFQSAFSVAKKQVVSHAISRIQKASGEAVTVLSQIMNNPQNPPSPRVTAARTVLDMALRSIEIEDLLGRLKALEHLVKKAGLRP